MGNIFSKLDQTKVDDKIAKCALLNSLLCLEKERKETRSLCKRHFKELNKENATTISVPAKPLPKKVFKEIIPESDGRTRITDTHLWYSSVHGVVLATFSGKNYWASGTLIGPNIVLTAAHILYDAEIRAKAKTVRFLPAINETFLPYKEPKVVEFYFPDEFVESKGEAEDYGILVLDTNLENDAGFFGVIALKNEMVEKKKVYVTGYPADKVSNKIGAYEMWEMKGFVKHIDENYISYEIDTFSGQNGSAVWFEEDGNYFACGVNVKSDIEKGLNKATVLTQSRIERIQRWLTKYIYKGSSFPMIERLDICMFYSGPCLAEYIVKKDFINLKELVFNSNHIGSDGVKYLIQAKWPDLNYLSLCDNGIGPEGAKYLIQGNWPKLDSLNLDHNSIGSDGVKYLIQGNWSNLRHLSLCVNGIGPEGMKYLVQRNWPKLFDLDLNINELKSDGMKHFVQANWPNLEFLSLYNNGIKSDDVKYLIQGNLPKLQRLDLSGNDAISEGIKHMIQEKWPKLNFH